MLYDSEIPMKMRSHSQIDSTIKSMGIIKDSIWFQSLSTETKSRFISFQFLEQMMKHHHGCSLAELTGWTPVL